MAEPAAPTTPAPKGAGFFDDPKRVAMVIGGALCLGVIIGFRIAQTPEAKQAAEGLAQPNPFAPPPAEVECAGCRERRIRDQQARENAARFPVPPAVPTDPPATPGPAPTGSPAPGAFDHSAPANGPKFSHLATDGEGPHSAPAAG